MKAPCLRNAVSLTVALLFLAANGRAANVNAGTGYTNDFSSQPLAADWTTRSFATGSGSTTGSEITTLAALHTAVQTNSAGLFSAQCASATGSPPNAAANAVWASAGGYLQTRPTSAAVTLLMAKLVNNTGDNATGVHINYDYTTNRVTAQAEEMLGHVVYYSLTGAAQSWSNIAALSLTGQGTLSVDLTLSGVWSNGATLYLLWADDNGTNSPDTALDIDNFFASALGTAPAAPFCNLTVPTNSQSFGAPASVLFTATAGGGEGATITGVGFYEAASGLLGSDLVSPYTNSVILSAGSYSLYAVATNSLGATIFSATNTVTVTNVPLSVALTSPANAASFGAPASVTLSANAYPGSGATITGVGFFDVASGPLGSALVFPYTTSTNLSAGTYNIYAVATNSFNATVFSATNTITVTNVPLSVTLTSPANGATLGSPATVTLTASANAGSSGSPISSVAFYMASNGTRTLLFTDVAAPYSNQLSGLTDGSYSFFAVVTNNLNATAISTTNAITVSSLVSGTVTRGPYLGSRGTTNITIRWRTTETTVGRVRFGLALGSLTSFADDTTSRTDHSVTLTGLTPETKYYYSIGTTAGTIQASANYYFSTAPPVGSSRATRMWFISDYGGGDATQTAVRDAYLNYTTTNGHATDVWLTGGDNEQSGMTGADATYQTTVFNVYSNIFQNTPVFPTCGNHDGGSSSAYWSIYSQPTQGECGGVPSGSQHYYSFDYANIHFISLDAYNNGAGAGAFPAQLQWLTNDLTNNTQPWIIAYWHEPPYCKNFYDSDTESMCKATRENFNPVLESYGVDIVMNGHCHALQRTYLINGHYGLSTTFGSTNLVQGGDGRADGDGAYQKTTKSGTVYITAPAGCGLAHPGSGTMAAFAERLSYTIYGCLVLDVNSNRLDFKMLSSAGAVGDYFTILKPINQVTPPTLTGGARVTNGVFAAMFQATAGLTYTLQSEDLLNNTWQNRSNITAPTNGLIVIQAPVGGATNRYYRLIYPAQ